MKRPTLYSRNGLRFFSSWRATCARGAACLAVALGCLSIASAQSSEVKQLWTKNCGSCHGPDGKGDTKAGKKVGVVDLTQPETQARSSDEKMFKSVKEGILDEKGKSRMKPAEKLTDAEIKKLVAFVRSLNKEKQTAQ
jgi:mono/diheme cytochrome c family protein